MPKQFCEVAIGDFKHRGMVVPVEDLELHVKHAQATKQSLFRSYYTFDEELVGQLNIRRTIKGFPGLFYLPEITLDVDKGKLTHEENLNRLRVFLKDIQEKYKIPPECIHVFFSGTGYHVALPNIFQFAPSKSLHTEVAATLTHYFPECDKIYDYARLVRVAGTINDKSGLYKIPLSLEEVNTLPCSEVEALAKEPRVGYSHAAFPDSFPTLPPLQRELGTTLTMEDTPHIKSQPGQIVTCVQTMYENGEKADRHNHILRMASAWRRAGVPLDGVVALMQRWSKTLEPYEVQRLVQNVFEGDYRYGCRDIFMEKYCSPKCIHFAKKDYTADLVNARRAEEEYIEFLQKDFSTISFNLDEMYTWHVKDDGIIRRGTFQVLPGELVVVMGDTGLGKTAWVQNICVHLRRMKILYLSLEVHQHLAYRRFVQIAHGYTKDEVIAHYKSGGVSLAGVLDHISVMTVSPDLSTISRLVAELNPAVVVVDTTDSIKVKDGSRDLLQKEEAIVLGLKEIAQNQETIVIGVHHLSKMAASMPRLTVHAGKGSSALEQKADKVIGIEGPADGSDRLVTSLKARDEERMQLKLTFNKETFRFSQK